MLTIFPSRTQSWASWLLLFLASCIADDLWISSKDLHSLWGWRKGREGRKERGGIESEGGWRGRRGEGRGREWGWERREWLSGWAEWLRVHYHAAVTHNQSLPTTRVYASRLTEPGGVQVVEYLVLVPRVSLLDLVQLQHSSVQISLSPQRLLKKGNICCGH